MVDIRTVSRLVPHVPTRHLDMRPSVSLNSLFSAFGARSFTNIASLGAIPHIRVTESSDPAFSSSFDELRTPRTIRPWRILGTLGDINLHIPGRAWTRGERLALARRGYATGSFRLNCSESLFVLDPAGRPLFQTIDSNAAGGKYGDMEKPLKEGDEKTFPRTTSTIRIQESSSSRVLHKGPLSADPFRERAFATRFKSHSSYTISNSRFSKSPSSCMASSLTFSEGLCNFHSTDDSEETASSPPSAEISPSFSFSSFSSGALAKFDSIKNFKGADLFDSWKGRQKRLERKRRPKPLTLSVSLTKTQTIRLANEFSSSEIEQYEPRPTRIRSPNPFVTAFANRPVPRASKLTCPPPSEPLSGAKAKRHISMSAEDIFNKIATSIKDDAQAKDSVTIASGLYLSARQSLMMAKTASLIPL